MDEAKLLITVVGTLIPIILICAGAAAFENWLERNHIRLKEVK